MRPEDMLIGVKSDYELCGVLLGNSELDSCLIWMFGACDVFWIVVEMLLPAC